MLPGKVYTPEDVLEIAKKRIWLLLVPLAVVSAVVAVVVDYLPNQYRSETVLLVVPQRVPEAYVRPTVTTRIEDRLQTIAQQILSRTRLERIIQDFNLYAEERQTEIMEDIVEDMRRDIELQVVRGDSFRVSYVGHDPRMVMRVTERLAGLFIEENLREREVQAEGTNQFLQAQLEDARRRLIEQEKKVEDYRRRFGGQLPTQLDSNMQLLQNTQMQVQALVESVNRDRDRRLVLERQVADFEQQQQEAAVFSEATAQGPGQGTPAQQLAAARAMLSAAQRRLKPEHPDLKNLMRLVGELENKVAATAEDGPLSASIAPVSPADAARRKRLEDLRLEIEQLDRQLAVKNAEEQRLRKQIGAVQTRIEATPTRESEMTEMTRDYATLQQMYAQLLSRNEEAKLAANLERRQIGEQFRLIDAARVPERPFSPNRVRLNLLGLAGGLALGVLLLGLFEYRDRSFKTDQEVTRLLALPVLAVVPLMQSAAERKWAFRKTLVVNVGLGTTIAACVAVVAYTLIR